MLRMVKEDGPNGAPLIMIGFSHQNLDALRKGRPVVLDIDQMAMLGLGQKQMMIFAGENEESMLREAEHHGLLPEGAADRYLEELAKRGGSG